jgi:hypothetical protein
MSAITDYLNALPGRVSYSQGMMLDAQDFADEQDYHRRQLSLVLRHLAGSGTLAGLKVTVEPPAPGDGSEQLRIAPGVAVDRLGRLIEVPKAQCLRLSNWLAYRMANQPARLAPLVQGGSIVLLADIFLGFGEVGAGLRPAFPEGVVNATDAAVPARTVESFALSLEPRPCLSPATEPDFPWSPPAAPADRAALMESIFKAYEQDLPAAGYPDKFDNDDADLSAVFLGRIRIPLASGSGAACVRDNASPVTVDNSRRPFLPAGSLLATLLPQA